MTERALSLEETERLSLAERGLETWDEATVGIDPDQQLRLIEAEIAELKLLSDRPGRASDLIIRYRALAEDLTGRSV